MQNEMVDVFDLESSGFQGTAHNLGHGAHGELEDLRPGHVDVVVGALRGAAGAERLAGAARLPLLLPAGSHQHSLRKGVRRHQILVHGPVALNIESQHVALALHALQQHGATAIAKQDAGAAVPPVNEATQSVRADDEHIFEVSTTDHVRGVYQPHHKTTASRCQVVRRRVLRTKLGLHQACTAENVVGGGGTEDDEVDILSRHVRHFKCLGRCFGAQICNGLILADNMPLFDPSAGFDPFRTRFHQALHVRVREDVRRNCRPSADHTDSILHAFRISGLILFNATRDACDFQVSAARAVCASPLGVRQDRATTQRPLLAHVEVRYCMQTHYAVGHVRRHINDSRARRTKKRASGIDARRATLSTQPLYERVDVVSDV
mmetsp:Transcript_26789/g.44919  ORF Transcript_26789/g.44919 Transcript_26789/m.44919 type:complete len:378 (-) Transcript_26789:97-1230(-)